MKRIANLTTAVIALALCALSAGAEAATVLSAQTSRPNSSLYIPGEAVPIHFTITDASDSSAPLVLHIKTVDEHFDVIAQKDLPVSITAGDGSVDYLAPNARLGFYRTYATLSDGTTIPAIGSRAAGYLTYCIVPDPATRVVYPPDEARFGMQGGFNSAVNTAPYLGFHWINGPGFWKNNEPDHAGQFAESRAALPAATRTAAQKEGKKQAWPLYPVFALYNPPDWAIIPGKRAGSTAPLLPSAQPAWDSYCRQFAKSVVEDYPDLPVHFYQITWEPNWFNGTTEQFVTIYKIAYTALHAVDPKAVVGGPTKSGVGAFGMDAEAQWFKQGLGSDIDAYTIHPYNKMPGETNGYIDKLRLLINFPSQHAGRAIPVYSTEQGDATDQDPSKELGQARALIRSSLITLGEGCKFYFGFFIHDYAGEPGYGYFYNLYPDRHFGSDRLAPKPIVPAFAAETSLIDGHDTVGPVDYLGPTSLGYAFQRGSDVVLALWDYGTQTHTVSIDAGTPTVRIYDWMGNARTVKTQAGRVSVTLSQDPLYIRGVSPAVWGNGADRLLNLTTNSVSTMPGGSVQISGSVHASQSSALHGVLHVSDFKTTQSVALAPGTSKSVDLSVNLPSQIAFGPHVLTVHLDMPQGKSVVRHVLVNVKQPIDVISVVPAVVTNAASNGQLSVDAVRISLSNNLTKDVSGKIALSLAGQSGGAQTTFDLTANSGSILQVPCSGLDVKPGAVYQASLRVTTSSGYNFTKPASIDLLSAAYIAKAPMAQTVSNQTPPANIQPNVRLGWDMHALYIHATVNDSDPAQSGSDKLQVAVNLDPGKIERSTGDIYNDLLSKRRFSILSLGESKNGPKAVRSYSNNPDKLHGGALLDWELPLKITTGAGVTTYDATIPWKALGTTDPPAAGSVLGFAVSSDGALSTDSNDLGSLLLETQN